METKIILQKFIADSGYCSRRRATELMKQGKVKVNKEVAELGQRVSRVEKVFILGKEIKVQGQRIYIKLNKPVDYVCTNRRFENEKSVFDLVNIPDKLICAGRLDKNSKGLVILTNDGAWVNKITHPSFEHEKEYLVKIEGDKATDQNEELKKKKYDLIISQMQNGIEDEGEKLKAKSVQLLKYDNFKIVLTYGKKRHIRRMFKALGLEVVEIVRVRIGDIKLGGLKEGRWEQFKHLE